jgi:hypothetical protein
MVSLNPLNIIWLVGWLVCIVNATFNNILFNTQSKILGAVVVVIVWYLDLRLHVLSVPITTKVVSSNPVHGEVYYIQYYVIKFVSEPPEALGILGITDIYLNNNFEPTTPFLSDQKNLTLSLNFVG